jgi:WD40 repeat protein
VVTTQQNKPLSSRLWGLPRLPFKIISLNTGWYKIHIWNAQTGEPLHTYLYTIGNPVDALAWSPDSKKIAFSGRDATVQIYDTSTEVLLLTYKGHSKEVDALAWSRDGNYMASGSYDATAQVWDAKTGATKLIYNGHSDIVDVLAWSPDGKKIVSGSWDNTAQVWATEVP